MLLVHDNFNILLDLEIAFSKKIFYTSEVTMDRSKYYRWLPSKFIKQIAYQSFISLDMAKKVLKSKKNDAIFIFEHKPQYSLFLYLVCIYKNVPVFFLVHGIQQSEKKSVFHFVGMQMLRFLVRYFKFWPIHIELSDKGIKGISSFSKSLIMLHPQSKEASCDLKIKNEGVYVRIGIVGILRKDKPILPLLETLSSYAAGNKSVKLYLGTPFWQKIPSKYIRSNMELIDTSSKKQYFNFLDTLDIVVTNFDKNSFYFRPSGIINDAISSHCYVLAPNFPVFYAQLNNPVKVGETYDNFEQLDTLLDYAVGNVKSGNVDFKLWKEARSNNKIITDLGLKMLEIIESK